MTIYHLFLLIIGVVLLIMIKDAIKAKKEFDEMKINKAVKPTLKYVISKKCNIKGLFWVCNYEFANYYILFDDYKGDLHFKKQPFKDCNFVLKTETELYEVTNGLKILFDLPRN